jgi:hypothetical protein
MDHAMDFAKFKNWNGDASELAQVASKILTARGLGETLAEPNVRLLRDYAQRGIVSRPARHGKEAIYAYRQLLEFIAARVLVADGWPLAKIAEHFGHIDDLELFNLIAGDGGKNRARSVIERIRSETQVALARDATHPSADKSEQQSPSTQFRERAARLSGIQAEMRNALRRLGLPEDGPAVEQVTLLAVAPWCQVLVESGRFSRITIEEAEEIGRAVTASLLTVTDKGAKTHD